MIFSLLISASVLVPSVNINVTQRINAQNSSTLSQTTRTEIKSTIVENRCERVTDRVNNHTRAGENVKDRRARIHQGVINRLEALFTKLDEKGCDTANATANLDTWESMIDGYQDNFNAWLDALHEVQNKVCQENAADYRASLQAVHEKRKLVQDKKREISQYYINTLKPSIRQLRTSCKETE